MTPLSDGIPARRFPYVNVALIVANFAVWIFYELPRELRAAVELRERRGVAFFAHVGGFVFGFLVATVVVASSGGREPVPV
jgi:hypothetical protein